MTSFGRHTRPGCNLGHSRDLFCIKWCGWMMLTSIQCVFIDFRWCEGSAAPFECLRMRSRSRRKCAHMNAGDLGSIFGALRMCLRSHSRDCAGQKPGAELRMRPTTTHVGSSYKMRLFFTPCQGAARWLVERGHVNHFMQMKMLMSHVTLSNNTSIVFAALWLVRTWYSLHHY